MKKLTFLFIVITYFLLSCNPKIKTDEGTLISDSLMYHPIRLDQNGKLLPWVSFDLGKSYNSVITLVWTLWKNIKMDSNEVRYYLNHHEWKATEVENLISGDQIPLTLTSFRLLYQYLGEKQIIDNMKYLADYYLTHAFSDSTDLWPNIPYTCITQENSGIYNGDNSLGKQYIQPDQAGSFGYELLNLYKITKDIKYLKSAIKIANSLAMKIQPGDSMHSPLPFKVNAKTGKIGYLKNTEHPQDSSQCASYTTNWPETLKFFEELYNMDPGKGTLYKTSFNKLLKWMLNYPLKNNRWGPYFEDPPSGSNSQINATNFATYILMHQNYFENWPSEVRKITAWVYHNFSNNDWGKYGVVVINEQSNNKLPRYCHTSPQASVDLSFNEYIKDSLIKDRAIRQLNWTTYMINNIRKQPYPKNELKMTDVYGDYVIHFIRSMEACPELAPSDKNHLLGSSSVVTKIMYTKDWILYTVDDNKHHEVFRLTKKPKKVMVSGIYQYQADCSCKMGWNWRKLKSGGVLIINTDSGIITKIIF